MTTTTEPPRSTACPAWCTTTNDLGPCWGDHAGDAAVITGSLSRSVGYSDGRVIVRPLRCDLQDGQPGALLNVREDDGQEGESHLTVDELRDLIAALQAVVAKLDSTPEGVK